MFNRYKPHLHLHFIVLLYGFTAILGKLISVDAAILVIYRMFIAIVGLWFILIIKKQNYSVSTAGLIKILGVGIIVGIHWVTFFHSIKISNVSVALGCLASTTLMTSFLDPLIHKKRISSLEVIIGLLIIVGLYIIFRFETRYTEGIIVALISAFAAGLFTVLNKALIKTYESEVISFYEMISGFLAVVIYVLSTQNLIIERFYITGYDFIYLLILGLVCTTYAFSATVNLMKVLSAYIVVLSINMEPIYGIILAFMIFGESEYMSSQFYIGTAIIVLSIFIYPIVKTKFKNFKNLYS